MRIPRRCNQSSRLLMRVVLPVSDLTREGDKPSTSLNAVYQSSKRFLDLSCAAQKTWIGIHIARGAALVL
jgi:hypothetical protein